MCTDLNHKSSRPDEKADPKASLERLLGEYPIQASIMQNLALCDFRNLQTAGFRVPATNRALQKKHLMPIHCNHLRYMYDSNRVLECQNTPEDVQEINACEGITAGRDDPRIDLREPCLEHGKIQSDRFWACSHCRHESRQTPEWDHYFFFERLKPALCETHSRELYQQRPHNACSCWSTVFGNHWVCADCFRWRLEILRLQSERSFDEVPLTLTVLGVWTFIVFSYLEWLKRWLIKAQHLVNRFTPWCLLSKIGLRPRHLTLIQWRQLCPMKNCTQERWVRDHMRMQMCMGCKAIFPG